jgi:uncharacterized protein YprB with RNaseH-like and TPR domain
VRPRLTAERFPLEELVGGGVEETESGPILAVRRSFSLEQSHGALALGSAAEIPSWALELLGRSPAPAPDPRRLLYLDTETTGLAGGTGTYAFLVGAGFFKEDAFVVTQYFMRDLDEEPALVASLARLISAFEGVVTYNGSGFDLPLLETRFVLARRPWPTAIWHLDLLRPARSLWGWRLPDCRLGTVERHLGVSREEDAPGALIPSLYFDYLRRRWPGEMPRVFAHNRADVLSLVTLAGWVALALAEPGRLGLSAEEYAGLGRLWERAGEDRGAECYRAALDLGLPSPARERLLLRLGLHEKRRSRWEAACEFWEASLSGSDWFDPRPWEELAKYHEHRSRDIETAHRVVTAAIAVATDARVDPEVLERLRYRSDRLARRLSVRKGDDVDHVGLCPDPASHRIDHRRGLRGVYPVA